MGGESASVEVDGLARHVVCPLHVCLTSLFFPTEHDRHLNEFGRKVETAREVCFTPHITHLTICAPLGLIAYVALHTFHFSAPKKKE